MTIAFYRSLFACLAFMPFLMRGVKKQGEKGVPALPVQGEVKKAEKVGKRWHTWAAVMFYAMVMSLFVLANKLTTSANAIALQYTAPLWVMIWAVLFLKEPLLRANVVCLAIAAVGIGVIVRGGQGTPEMTGILVALASGLAFSGFTILHQVMTGVSPLPFVALCNGVTAGVLLPWLWGNWEISIGQLVGLLVMGVVQLGVPYALFVKGMQTIRAQEASLIMLIEPVLNPLWVYFVVGEAPSTATLIGGGCILAGLAGRFLLVL